MRWNRESEKLSLISEDIAEDPQKDNRMFIVLSHESCSHAPDCLHYSLSKTGLFRAKHPKTYIHPKKFRNEAIELAREVVGGFAENRFTAVEYYMKKYSSVT